MAKVRIGFSSHFEVENETVGIGTDQALDTLHVTGDIIAHNIDAAGGGGITTVTTYDGFINKETKLTLSSPDINLNFQSHTLSGEIIIDSEVTVSSGTTFTSGPENLTVKDNFTLPGISDDRPTVGTTRFNENLGALEFYTGLEWKAVNSYVDVGRGRGYFAGGRTKIAGLSISVTKSIESVELSSLGKSQDFGLLSNTRRNHGNCSSLTRGLCISGSYNGSPSTDIEYFTLASQGVGVDFGAATQSDQGESALASSTRGVHATGNPSNKKMDYVEIATTGNAVEFGERVISLDEHGAIGSATRGLFCGGGAPSGTAPNATMQLITIASKGDATTFGDLTETKGQLGGGVSNGVRGAVAGGYGSPAQKKRIDYINFASDGNAIHFGDLMIGRGEQAGAASNRTRGLIAGGYGSTYLESIEYIVMSTTGDAQDFGDLTIPRERIGGGQISDSHGGLGGY